MFQDIFMSGLRRVQGTKNETLTLQDPQQVSKELSELEIQIAS